MGFILVSSCNFTKFVDEAGDVNYCMRREQEGFYREIPFTNLPEMQKATEVYKAAGSYGIDVKTILNADVKTILNTDVKTITCLQEDLKKVKTHELRDKIIRVVYLAIQVSLVVAALLSLSLVLVAPWGALAIGIILESEILLFVSTLLFPIVMTGIEVVFHVMADWRGTNNPLVIIWETLLLPFTLSYMYLSYQSKKIEESLCFNDIERLTALIEYNEKEIEDHLSSMVKLFSDKEKLQAVRSFFEKLRDNDEIQKNKAFLENIETALSEIDEAEKFYDVHPSIKIGGKSLSFCNRPSLKDLSFKFR